MATTFPSSQASDLKLTIFKNHPNQIEDESGDWYEIDTTRPALFDVPEDDWACACVNIPVRLSGGAETTIIGTLTDLVFLFQHRNEIGLTFKAEEGSTIPAALAGLFIKADSFQSNFVGEVA